MALDEKPEMSWHAEHAHARSQSSSSLKSATLTWWSMLSPHVPGRLKSARSATAIAVIVLFLLLSVVLRNSVLPAVLEDLRLSSAQVFRTLATEDKAVILARVQGDDTEWVLSELPDWQKAIYYMDDHTKGNLHPPANKGREAMAYLTFLIDHYHWLPSTMVFIHPHLAGWPQAWHTDNENYNNLESIRSLRLDYVRDHGYVNMRCIHAPGCFDEIQVYRNDPARTAEVAMLDAWPYMFGGNRSEIPEVIAQPCCSQFAVSKKQVLKRPKSDYVRYRQWLLESSLSDDATGRVFEYLWHVIFGRDDIYCPDVRQCKCFPWCGCADTKVLWHLNQSLIGECILHTSHKY
jgi:hypothetical protein